MQPKRPVKMTKRVAFLVLAAVVGAVGDTADRIDDPEALREQVERLRLQKPWTENATPAQIALFDGPATEWSLEVQGEFELEGFDADLLGSEVPAPGVHPRILMSPEDVPFFRRRLESSEAGRAVLAGWKAGMDKALASEGYASAVRGELEFEPITKAGRTGMASQLALGALHCLLFEDDENGKKVADYIVAYYSALEYSVDAQNALGADPAAEDSWPDDLWRGMHEVVGLENLGFCYDYGAKWMSDGQKTVMRRIIRKATHGKRAYGMNGPVRWRDTNWVTWDLTMVPVLMAIEGENGYDAEVYEKARETVRAFLKWGISPEGTLFEPHGKNGAGMAYLMTSMAIMARRGDNYFGHPHFRKVTGALVQQYVPAGDRSVDNGTWGGANFEVPFMLKAFFPDDRRTSWLLRRKPGVSWQTGPQIYACDPIADESDAWDPPLAVNDESHGRLVARSGTDKDALFLMLEARNNLFSVGHHHHDAGHFYFSALGVNWGIEGHPTRRASDAHSVVVIDGKGQGDLEHAAPARAHYLGAVVNSHAAVAATDLKYAYDYVWSTPMHYSWAHEETAPYRWEPDTSDWIVGLFKGTQQVKMRIWAMSYWDQNWGPTMRAEYNPVEFAFRTAGIVRGKHPYAVVVDDIKKDDAKRLYEWQMQVPADMRLVADEAGRILLGVGDEREEGEPLLWVKPLEGALALSAKLEPGGAGNPKGQRFVLAASAVTEARFRVLLIPLRSGQAIPECVSDPRGGASLAWGDQVDTLVFQTGGDQRTRLRIRRDGATIVETK